jgi:hypothetical protein
VVVSTVLGRSHFTNLAALKIPYTQFKVPSFSSLFWMPPSTVVSNAIFKYPSTSTVFCKQTDLLLVLNPRKEVEIAW